MTRLLPRHPFAWLWLTATWVIMWGEVTVANVLAGFLVGAVVLTALPMPPVIVGVRLHPGRFVVMVVRFFRDVVVASFNVAWLAVRPRDVPHSSVITVQLGSRNELFQTVVGEMMSLVPGSLIVDLDAEAGRLSMHVLEVETAREADEFRQRVLDQEHRVLQALASEAGAELHVED